MGESLIQPCRVQEEGLMGCKLLLQGRNKVDLLTDDSTLRISIG